jgi:hypothetical protein
MCSPPCAGPSPSPSRCRCHRFRSALYLQNSVSRFFLACPARGKFSFSLRCGVWTGRRAGARTGLCQIESDATRAAEKFVHGEAKRLTRGRARGLRLIAESAGFPSTRSAVIAWIVSLCRSPDWYRSLVSFNLSRTAMLRKERKNVRTSTYVNEEFCISMEKHLEAFWFLKLLYDPNSYLRHTVLISVSKKRRIILAWYQQNS